MSVQNGQKGNKDSFNNAFMSRTSDTSAEGKVTLKRSVESSPGVRESGADVLDVQKAINDLKTADAGKYSAQKTLTNTVFVGGTRDANHQINLPSNTSTALLSPTPADGEIAYDTVKGKPVFSKGGLWSVMGSGSGGGGAVNWVDDPSGANGATTWVPFDDGATLTNLAGNGSNKPTTLSVQPGSTTTLSADGHMYRDIGALTGTVNNGWAKEIAVAPEYRGYTAQVSASVLVTTSSATGTFVMPAGSLKFALYDITNAKLIPFSESENVPVTVVDGIAKFSSRVVIPNNSGSFRLGFYRGASTAAFTFFIASISIGPQLVNRGAVVTDLVNAGTITIGATTSAPTKGAIVTDVIRVGRRGDHAIIKGEYRHSTAGTVGSGDYLISLPNNLQFDPNKVTFYTGTPTGNSAWPSMTGLGTATLSNNGSQGIGVVIPYDATRFRIGAIYTSAGTTDANRGIFGSGFFSMVATVQSITFDFEAPILGWSSNTVMSSEVSGQRVAMSAYPSSNRSIPNGGVFTRIDLDSVHYDSVGGVTTGSSWTYRVPETDVYDLDAFVTMDSVGATVQVRVTLSTGTELAYGAATTTAGGFWTVQAARKNVKLQAGALIYVAVAQSSGAAKNLIAGPGPTGFSIKKSAQGGQQIAASDPVVARYYSAAGQVLNTGDNTLTLGSKREDTHNAWNGSKFVAPLPGLYYFKCRAGMTAINGFAGNSRHGLITRISRAGGSFEYPDSDFKFVYNTTNGNPPDPNLVEGFTRLAIQDAIEFIFNNSTGSQKAMVAFEDYANVQIVRVGL